MTSVPDEPSDLDPTRFWIRTATEAEKEEFWELATILRVARSQVVRFRACIALADMGFHHLTQSAETGGARHPHRSIFWEWPNVAAHGAIGTLYQFAEALEKVQEWVEKSEARTHLTDTGAVESASDLFSQHFPKWKVTRHATSHSAEISLDPDKNWHRAALSSGPVVKSKGSTMLMQDSFENRTFITTRRGELLRFDVTWENYLKFRSVYDLLLEGMQPPPQQWP